MKLFRRNKPSGVPRPLLPMLLPILGAGETGQHPLPPSPARPAALPSGKTVGRHAPAPVIGVGDRWNGYRWVPAHLMPKPKPSLLRRIAQVLTGGFQ